MAFYELRQYKVLPGKMDEWVRVMEQEIIPFQVSKGMVITASFRGEKDDSVYVWMRRFESEAEREALYKAVYESDYWKKEMGPRIPEYLDRSAMVISPPAPESRQSGLRSPWLLTLKPQCTGSMPEVWTPACGVEARPPYAGRLGMAERVFPRVLDLPVRGDLGGGSMTIKPHDCPGTSGAGRSAARAVIRAAASRSRSSQTSPISRTSNP